MLSTRSLLVLHIKYGALGFLIPLSPPHYVVAVAAFFFFIDINFLEETPSPDTRIDCYTQ